MARPCKTKAAAPAAEVKGAEVTTAEVKTADQIEAAAPAAEVKPEVVEEVKAPEKKPVKKEAVKKKKVKKETVKKEAAPKKDIEANVYVQFGGAEIEPKKVLEQVKEAWVAAGHRASSIKTIALYIKPEEATAYYVINDKERGQVAL